MSSAALEIRSTQLRADRIPFVRARVVLAEKPTSAKPGDEAIVHADGTIEGFVGGSCAESTVRMRSLALLDPALSPREPLLLRITPEPEETKAGTVTVHNPCLSGGTLEIFLEAVVPAPLLLVLGDNPVSAALRAVGAAVDFQVEDYSDALAIAGPHALVVSSHGRDEIPALDAALAADVPYVALVASRKRGAAVLSELTADETSRARVHTPAGLDIGARTPAEIAISILAEIISERRQHHARSSGTSADCVVPAEPASAVDPVCGMTVAAVAASLHLDLDLHRQEPGRRAGDPVADVVPTRYYFCGSGCLQAFSADPQSYLAV